MARSLTRVACTAIRPRLKSTATTLHCCARVAVSPLSRICGRGRGRAAILPPSSVVPRPGSASTAAPLAHCSLASRNDVAIVPPLLTSIPVRCRAIASRGCTRCRCQGLRRCSNFWIGLGGMSGAWSMATGCGGSGGLGYTLVTWRLVVWWADWAGLPLAAACVR
jgi:hypothetical protein